MKTYVGIDPGKNGGIAAIYPDLSLDLWAMPQKDNEIDGDKLTSIIELIETGAEVFHQSKALFAIEDVHSVYGSSAKSNFQFGRSLGIIEGVLYGKLIIAGKVPPKTWQHVAFKGIEKIKLPGERTKGKGVYDNKAMALQAVQRMYPGADLRKSSRAKNPHDGIIDALLIANYLKSKHEN